MLKLEGVVSGYGDIDILHELSLEVREGEIVSVVGANGAGKSTTLRTISGLQRVRAGSITFDGHRLDHMDTDKIVEMGVAQTPEGRQLFNSMTVLENLNMGAITRHAKPHRANMLEQVFALFPILDERKEQIAGTLSGGEQQMCAIGRGLMTKPKLLMLDEPSLGLAPLVVRSIFDVVKRIREEGVTVMLVEQNLVHALNLSDRGYVIEGGRVVLEGASSEVLANPLTRQAYLGVRD